LEIRPTQGKPQCQAEAGEKTESQAVLHVQAGLVDGIKTVAAATRIGGFYGDYFINQ
jgi:hypothetical protein